MRPPGYSPLSAPLCWALLNDVSLQPRNDKGRWCHATITGPANSAE
jgi:hypothetical protein